MYVCVDAFLWCGRQGPAGNAIIFPNPEANTIKHSTYLTTIVIATALAKYATGVCRPQ